ncbi:MAG: hypothetical protein A3A00_00210 [Candidatus Spechtbacteria bacterium RIFCSPLOWO2_01_FULL_38_20]|nr:MAG: hypothetical protein A3A00_00210 [Candidatus Spechtbacteria bacterium RIFCSPLOWO2_01_FULL_38_20]
MSQSQKLNLKPLVARILKILSDRNGSILALRHGVEGGSKNTLENVGKKYGITRERVRQIEEASYDKIRNSNEFNELGPAFATIENFLKQYGGVSTEEKLMNTLVPSSQKPHLSLLLALNKNFVKIQESDDFETIWANDKKSANTIKNMLTSLISSVEKLGTPLDYKQLLELVEDDNSLELNNQNLPVVLSISKKLQKGPFNKWGLSNWPQINPRGVRDKAHLVMERHGQPLHFKQLAIKIDEYLGTGADTKKTHPQTAHNELIKDDRFVLIGRGTYALADWGYVPGTVKDVIIHILQKEGKPMRRDELMKRVMEQRKVQENTIALNLQNKELFRKQENQYYLT